MNRTLVRDLAQPRALFFRERTGETHRPLDVVNKAVNLLTLFTVFRVPSILL